LIFLTAVSVIRLDNSQLPKFALLNMDTSTTLRVSYLSRPKSPYATLQIRTSVVSIAPVTSQQAAMAIIPYNSPLPVSRD
jgi:hypothetical protein